MRIHRSAWLLAILSGVLQILVFPLPGLYMLCWLALSPLIIAILRARRAETLQLSDSAGLRLVPASISQGFVLAYACGILWYAGTCYWVFDTMHQYGGLSRPAAFGILVLFCLYLALYHGAFGALLALAADRGTSLSRRALLAAPFLWVATEFARTRITGFPWNLLGTVQVDNFPLARIATFTGVYGLSFEIMLVNTAVAVAFLVRREKRKTLFVAALGAAFALQAGRWLTVPPAITDHQAYLVQANIPILDNSEWTKDYFEGTLRDLTWITVNPPLAPGEKQAPTTPSIVVWPESPAPFYTSDPLFRDTVSGIARKMATWMVVGSMGVRNATGAQTTETYNSAALVSPTGEWVTRYDKVHLVPFGEYVPFRRLFSFAEGLTKEVGEFGRGTSRQPLDAGGARLGTFICYESVFPDEVRQFARNGAQVFVNISNDGWYGDSGAYAQHLQQSRMRAIENARWLLLGTDTGVTASVDPFGRIVANVPRKTRTTLRAPYALNSVTTFYTRHGDWFAYLCAIISLLALITRLPIRENTGS